MAASLAAVVAVPVAAGRPDRTVRADTGPCDVTHARAATPLTLPLGAEMRLTSTLVVACDEARAPLHLVLVVDASEQMVDRGRNLLAGFLTEMGTAVREVDLGEHRGARIGVVSFRDRVATSEVPLTGSATEVASGLHNIAVRNGLTCPQCGLREGLRKARRMLQAGRDGGPSPREVILVASRGFDPVACDAVRAAANEVKPFGVTLVTACGSPDCDRRCLSEAATSAEHAFAGPDWTYLGALLSDIVAPAGAFHPVARVAMTDRLGDLVEYVDGGEPDRVQGNDLDWEFAPWVGEVVTRTLRVRAARLGEGLVGSSGWATVYYRPATGVVSATIPLAGARIVVRSPTPVPTTPAPTPSPTATGPPSPSPSPTPTATATPGSRTHAIYLPHAATGACRPTREMDVVLLVDVSGSMGVEDVPPFQSRWSAASGIGQELVRYHIAATDRVAVIPFAAEVEVRAGLAQDRERALQALAALPRWNGSRLDLALAAAHAELEAGARERPEGGRAIVLLTDGDLNQTEARELELRAAEIRAAGIRLLAVGLGADADPGLLARLAGARGRVFVTAEVAPMAVAAAVGGAMRCAR